MVKLLKKIIKTILWTGLGFLLVFIILVILMRIPAIQTRVTKYAITYITAKTHTRVDLKRINISLPKSVVIEGLYFEDLNKDTLLYADKIKVNLSLKGILKNRIHIRSVALEDACLNINRTETDSVFNYGFLLTAFTDTTKQPEPDPENTGDFTIKLDKLSMSRIRLDFHDRYGVGTGTKTKNAFDVRNLSFHDLSLYATDLYYTAEKTEAKIRKFSATDQNNFSILEFETEFSMNSQTITAENLLIKTNGSKIDADLSISYPSMETLMDSIGLLLMNLELRTVTVRNSDILYFSPGLDSLDFFKSSGETTSLSGDISGSVNNLTGKNVEILTGEKTSIKTDFEIEGLPATATLQFNFPNLEIITCKKDLIRLAGTSIPENIELPEEISLQADFTGGMKSFESTLGMQSSYGNAHFVASVDQSENFNIKAKISDFDLGSLLRDTAMFGPVAMSIEADGNAIDPKKPQANIRADVSRIHLNSYDYHNLKLDGKVNGREFEGKINLNDENAVFDFEGLVNLNPTEERYKFKLNVSGADLKKLHLSKNDLRIGFMAVADLKGGRADEINGNAGITNIIIGQNDKIYLLDSLFVATVNAPEKSDLNISSALIGINYTGSVSPIFLPGLVSQFINRYFPFSERDPSKETRVLSDFKFDIELHNHPILSEVLLPGLKEFEPGLIQGSFDSQTGNLKLEAGINSLTYGTSEIKDLALSVSSDRNVLKYRVSGRSISNAQIKLDNLVLSGQMADNMIIANISSIDEKDHKKLLIRSQITREGANYRVALDPEEFFLMNDRWNIAAGNFIEFGPQGFRIHDLFLNKAESLIHIASVNDQFNDDLSLSIKNFKLDDISRIFEKATTLIKGNADGNLLLKRVNGTYGLIANASLSNLLIREVPIGDLTLKAENPTTGKFDFDLKLSGSDNNLIATGYLMTNDSINTIHLQGDIQSLSMKTIEVFSQGEISEASGTLSGKFQMEGQTSAPEITGEVTFRNTFFKPAVLNSRLELKNETIDFKNDIISFKSFTLLDPDGNTAIIDGTIQMEKFSNLIFNLQVKTKDFLLFNTTARDNTEFNGRMIIDSNIDIKGPLTLPVINGKIKIKKNSNFTFAVPENKLTTDKGEDVVEFINSVTIDPILLRGEKKPKLNSGLSGFDLSAIIEIDKEATLKLLMDPSSTDSLVVKGEAALSFALDRSGKMSLTGAYYLEDGSYLVSLGSVIKKKFNIVSGSTIIWNGDPLDAEISINATYSVRAAPLDLVADQMSGLSDADKGAYKQKYPFLVFLKLRGEILHPQISFEIQLSPEDKGILGGVVNQKLNMLNEDASALNKQVFALLVLGRFVQENPLQTEAAGTSALIRTTVGKFLSEQLNQLSSKVIPGVDLNFDIQSFNDYQSGQAQGRTQVEIGLKKELFKERLSVQIGGSVDVEGESAKQNKASDITGDVTVEYKLTKDGRFRMKAFRHNQYEGAIEGQLVETGVGVIFLKNFNKWKDFFVRPKNKNDSSKKDEKQ